MAQTVKNLPAMQKTCDLGSIPTLGRSPGEGNGNPLQYVCLGIPWSEEPGGLQSMGSQSVRQDWATPTHSLCLCHALCLNISVRLSEKTRPSLYITQHDNPPNFTLYSTFISSTVHIQISPIISVMALAIFLIQGKSKIICYIFLSYLLMVPQPFLGEGNGNPLQYSCLENPMDGGTW